MKVTLPKDLELYGVRHLAGTEVDIEPEVYEKVMQSVVAGRERELQHFESRIDFEQVDKIEKMIKRGAKK